MSPMTRRQFLQIGAGSLGVATLGTGVLSVVAGAAPSPAAGPRCDTDGPSRTRARCTSASPARS